jgi:hypothetical protein
METEEIKLISLPSVEDCLDSLERIWHWKYLELVPLKKQLKVELARRKRIPIPSREDSLVAEWRRASEDDESVESALANQVTATLEYFARLTARITAQFQSDPSRIDAPTTQKLEAIFSRYCVIRADLERYLENYTTSVRRGGLAFSKAYSIYIEALNVNPDEGKAFSGLYIVATARSQPLLAFLYLVKSMVSKYPVRDQIDVIEMFAHRVASNLEDLTDVPLQARPVVAKCLELVYLHLDTKRDGASVVTEQVGNEIIKLTPRCVVDRIIGEEISWDTLIVILLMAVIDYTADRKVLERVLKNFIGRAITFGDVTTLCCVIPFLAKREWNEVAAPIKKQVISNGLVKVNFSKELASKPLVAIDHLIQFPPMCGIVPGTTCTETAEDIAGARLCLMLDIPFDQTVAVPKPSPPERSATSSPAVRKAPIIIDAANVACKAGEANRTAEIEGVVSAFNHWASKGHPVKIFVSEKHASRTPPSKSSRQRKTVGGISINLDSIYSLIPDNCIVSIPAQSHDDSYMIQYALHTDGIIVSNDMFRDWVGRKDESELAKEWTMTHVMPYTIIENVYFPDPDFQMPVQWNPTVLRKIT